MTTLDDRVTARLRWDSLPKCADCWNSDEPARQAMTLVDADEEVCRWCGGKTTSGIYVRAQDPVLLDLRAENERLREALRDAAWLAKLARGSSWPGEMAQRVEDAADRVIAAASLSKTGGE